MNKKYPFGFVSLALAFLVPVLVSLTLAPLMAAPELSVTVPFTCPFADCARTDKEKASKMTTSSADWRPRITAAIPMGLTCFRIRLLLRRGTNRVSATDLRHWPEIHHPRPELTRSRTRQRRRPDTLPRQLTRTPHQIFP